jgi:uncharacterized repeat protein (TIGR03803 family)
MSRIIPRCVVIQALAVVLSIFFSAADAWSEGYKVLYNFNSTNANPSSGLIVDGAGNAYGTTAQGGNDHSGTVYELSPTTGYHLLFAFSNAGHGGKHPQGNLVFDSVGNLYGTTVSGGVDKTECSNQGCGVVFELSPPSTNGGLWTETVLYSFCSQADCADGAEPQAGVAIDALGNLYGTTFIGGNPGCQEEGPGCGTVFELSLTESGWIESVIHEFVIGNGAFPRGSLIFDTAGNLYGTTASGGQENGGTVFELSLIGGVWNQSVIYDFNGSSGSTDGCSPEAGLTLDAAGNLYGTTAVGGSSGSGNGSGFGTVFELSPMSGQWVESILYSFTGGDDGANPESTLTLDAIGNLYGTTLAGGGALGCNRVGCGTIFELTPNGGEWLESLFRFPVNGQLGTQPNSQLFFNSDGKIYGTTMAGGAKGADDGVLFGIAR